MVPKTLIATAAVAALASACADKPPSTPDPVATRSAAALIDPVPTMATRPALKAVTTGVVVRGVNAPPPVGPSGTPNGRTCDFSREETDRTGSMTGTSVQCLPGGTVAQALANLPARFNSYCAVDAGRLKGRLISAPLHGNPQHCDLSGTKPSDAERSFGGGKWR